MDDYIVVELDWDVEVVLPGDDDWPEGVPADAPVWPMRDSTGFVWIE